MKILFLGPPKKHKNLKCSTISHFAGAHFLYVLHALIYAEFRCNNLNTYIDHPNFFAINKKRRVLNI